MGMTKTMGFQQVDRNDKDHGLILSGYWIPSGKLRVSYGKSASLIGKSTISTRGSSTR